MSYYNSWKPYVSVAKRRRQAQKEMQRLRKKGADIQPVEIEGRKIAKTFWGEAWCNHMEAQGDFDNRLPRGRTYVRNGSVCHLAIEKGRVRAKVSGSEIYDITINIDVLPQGKWKKIQRLCRGQIGTLLELLQGRVSDSVMKVVTDPKSGLFPKPREIHLNCNCPDYAMMCKHLSAVLYGIGARLDSRPELLFLLRGVDHSDLVTTTSGKVVAKVIKHGGRRRKVAENDLADVFGIDLDDDDAAKADSTVASRSTSRKKPERKKAKTSRAKKKTTKRRSAQAVQSRPSERLETAAESKPSVKKKKAAKKTPGKTKKSGTAASADKKSTKRPQRADKKKGGSAKLAKQATVKSGKRKKAGKKKAGKKKGE